MSEIRNNPNITTKELLSILSISVTAAAKNPAYLRQNGFIERVGSDRQKEASIEQQTRKCIPIYSCKYSIPERCKNMAFGDF